jgi:serine/threonine protein kinase
LSERPEAAECALVISFALLRGEVIPQPSLRELSMAVRIESNAEPIPGYKLIERLGGGGFGDVWKVEAPGGLLKAMKFVFGDLQDAGEDGHRAEQELKAMSRVISVRHPYILSLERFDIIDGQLIIVMELADRNLWDRFKECRSQGLSGIPREELLRYLEESAEALDLMNNDYQLQHLDIKPQNIFLVHNHAKVADFGLVKDLEGMAASVTGGVTPVYAAPETFDGWVSRFSDQYSLAIVYQELLTGQRPFAGNNVRQLIMQHLQAAPNLSSLSSLDAAVIGRSLSKNPDERFPTCLDMLRALRGAGSAASPGPTAKVDTAADLSGTDTPRCEMPGSAAVSGGATPDFRGRPPSPPPQSTLTPTGAGPKTQVLPRRVDVQRPAAAQPKPAAPVAQVELTGEGVLVPAILIGMGGFGLQILQRFREMVHERFGAFQTLPHLAMLYVDTDPEALRTATRGDPATALSFGEVLPARLNRPSHYLKPRDGRVQVETWLDPQMLYRIPRSQVTTGLRALGRLAFCDNYPMIRRRVSETLAAVCDPEALPLAARQTRLGLRSNRPRVYVITSLAGGTGGGMFLDVAYLVRSLLKAAGYAEPDASALLLLPAMDRDPARTLSQGNAYAALTELNHFASGGPFAARYQERDAPIQDAAAPFSRCHVLQLPKETDPEGTAALTGLAGEYLFQDLFSPLGRIADAQRPAAGARAAPTVQSFGMYRLSSPQRPLVRQVARRLCRAMVERWITKDATPLVEPVGRWVLEQWNREQFGAEALIERLQATCHQKLKQVPETAFAAIAAPITGRGKTSELDLSQVDSAMGQFHVLLGRHEEETLATKPAVLEEVLAEASTEVIQEWGQRLTEMTVHLLEDPAYRLAGAEEAIRQVLAVIEKLMQHHEPLFQELENRAHDAFGRIYGILDGLQKNTIPKGRLGAAVAELSDMLTTYPKLRYQFLVLRQVIRGFISLRGNLSDELREINFCRDRLGDMLKAFEDAVKLERKTQALPSGPGRRLFPGGCRDLAQAVGQHLGTMTPAQIEELEVRMQAMLRKEFAGLVNVCLGAANLSKNVELAMQQEAEGFISAGPMGPDVAGLLLEENPEEDQAIGEIVTAYDEACPDLTVRNAGETQTCVLAIPDGEAGQRLQALARQALPEVELVPAASPDDILIYRETAPVAVADLEQHGPLGYEAYSQMASIDHLSPHARTDLEFAHQ